MSSVNIDRLYDLLKAETDLQQKRVWFCGTLISALLTGWYLVNGNQNNSYNKNLKLILPFLATIIALIQCFLNRGSKYWFNYLHSQINKNINRDYEIYKDNITFPNCVEHLKGTGFLWAKRKVKIPMLFIFFADFVFINCLMLFLFEFNKYFNVFDCSNLSFLKLFFITNSLIVVIAFISRQSKWDNPCICKVSNITTLKDKIMCCKICESNDKNQCPAKIIDKNKIENIVKKKENNLIFCNTYFECKFWDIFE